MFNMELFKEANEKISETFLLANTITQRVRQLQEGADPLVDSEDMSDVDVALKEVAEGKIEARKEDVSAGPDIFGSVEE